MNLRALCALCVCLLCALCLTGCMSFDATDARRSQTGAFTNELSRLEAAWLAEPLTLERCVRIAMTNNYEVRKADLDAQLGRFSRDMAFSAFLPQVSASATRIDYDRNQVDGIRSASPTSTPPLVKRCELSTGFLS
ncbi:MAG: TolC family protein [Kiritimatiellae bacterium]|nr:TolC family protein [Kiritimatiellia bacterium]